MILLYFNYEYYYFTYNDKDLVQKSISDGSYFIIEYYDYVYDEQGTGLAESHNQNNSPCGKRRVETRTITYFK